jgi:hypothetical protein
VGCCSSQHRRCGSWKAVYTRFPLNYASGRDPSFLIERWSVSSSGTIRRTSNQKKCIRRLFDMRHSISISVLVLPISGQADEALLLAYSGIVICWTRCMPLLELLQIQRKIRFSYPYMKEGVVSVDPTNATFGATCSRWYADSVPSKSTNDITTYTQMIWKRWEWPQISTNSGCPALRSWLKDMHVEAAIQLHRKEVLWWPYLCSALGETKQFSWQTAGVIVDVEGARVTSEVLR